MGSFINLFKNWRSACEKAKADHGEEDEEMK